MVRDTVIMLLLTYAFACAADATTDTRVRTALDVFAQVIDPAYSMAMDGCIAPQQVAVAQAEAGLVTVERAQATIDKVRVRCARVRDGFEQIRIHHEQAVRSVEAGKLGQAEQLLGQIGADWSALRVGGDT